MLAPDPRLLVDPRLALGDRVACSPCCLPLASMDGCTGVGCSDLRCACVSITPEYCDPPTPTGPCDARPGRSDKCWGGVRDLF